MFRTNGTIQHVALVSGFLHNVSTVPPHRRCVKHSTPLHGWRMFQRVATVHLSAQPLTDTWAVSTFWLGRARQSSFVNRAAIRIHEQSFCTDTVFISLRVKLLGPVGALTHIFIYFQIFSKWLTLISAQRPATFGYPAPMPLLDLNYWGHGPDKRWPCLSTQLTTL